jgi:hypothetical protein
MKNFVVILLLFVSLLVGLFPYYSQENTSLSKIEKQLEDVSLSEIYTTTSIISHKNSSTLKTIKYCCSTLFYTCAQKSYFLYKINNILPTISKYGRQVLYGAFLN